MLPSSFRCEILIDSNHEDEHRWQGPGFRFWQGSTLGRLEQMRQLARGALVLPYRQPAEASTQRLAPSAEPRGFDARFRALRTQCLEAAARSRESPKRRIGGSLSEPVLQVCCPEGRSRPAKNGRRFAMRATSGCNVNKVVGDIHGEGHGPSEGEFGKLVERGQGRGRQGR